MINPLMLWVLKEEDGNYYLYRDGSYRIGSNHRIMLFGEAEFVTEPVLVDTYFERLREIPNVYVDLCFSEDSEGNSEDTGREIDSRIRWALERLTRTHNIWVNPRFNQ